MDGSTNQQLLFCTPKTIWYVSFLHFLELDSCIFFVFMAFFQQWLIFLIFLMVNYHTYFFEK